MVLLANGAFVLPSRHGRGTLVVVEARTALVGRDAEQRVLAAVVESAQRGMPAAVVIGGEAGVGKTRLVTEATTSLDHHGVTVLWGRCLRFGTAESAFQPIGQLLSQWFRQASDAERQRVLTGLPVARLATIAPILGELSEGDPGQLIPVLARALERICEVAPTVVVIDDLQWADTTSLDLLAYVVAGFGPGQRLALIGTYRDSDLEEGHRLYGWLADLRRLPSVGELHLGPLTLPDTEELVAQLCGEEGAVARGAMVHERSGGNPYLAELLALAPVGDPVAAGDLREALLASWHRLTSASRQVAQLLAVGGRPVSETVLEEVAAVHGLSREVTRACVREIIGAGIGTFLSCDQVWFRHPLLAEVLTSTVPPAELRETHAQYAARWEEAADAPPALRAAHLALHYEGAGHDDEAYDWSLRAADAAADVFGWAEEFEHLQRACRLWPRVTPDRRGRQADLVHLLRRASDSAFRAGEFPLALELRKQALGVVDTSAKPLEAARLYIHLDEVRGLCGVRTRPSVDEEMLALTEAFPDSPERAIALAQLARSRLWHSDGSSRSEAERAVRVARRSGSDEALAWALGVRAQIGWTTPEGLEDAEQALSHARACGDLLLITSSAAIWAECLYVQGARMLEVDSVLSVLGELAQRGSFYESVGLRPCLAADLIETGRWREARSLLRESLSRRVTFSVGADLRYVAADLAARSGNLAQARQHLARGHELALQRLLVGNFMVMAESRVALATGEPERALTVIAEAMPEILPIDEEAADDLLVWAARAAADLAATPGRQVKAVAWLEKIDAMRGETPPRFPVRRPDDRVHPAWARLHAAEVARCHDGGARRPELWAAAADSCAAAELPWEQALSSYRLAQSLLATKGSRARAAAALRDAARIATDLGAAPILADVEALAIQSHLSLDDPGGAPRIDDLPPALSGLTHREAEVLQHVVAGRTYAEIARDLFISEKTVSVHVSNLLRKTGTSSRIELADLARRLGSTWADPRRGPSTP